MHRTNTSDILVVAFAEKVFGIDRATGEIRWRVAIDVPASAPVELAVDEQVVIAVSESSIAFIDYASGELRKQVVRKDVARTARPVMLLEDGRLYIGGKGEMVCYTTDGALVWEQGFTGEGYGDIALGLPGRVRQADVTGH